MSLVRHIRRLNAHNPAQFTRFCMANRAVGWLTRPVADRLAGLPGFTRLAHGICLTYPRPADRNAALDEAVDRLIDDGLCPPRRDEIYAVVERWAGPVLAQIDRAACPVFGLQAFGVHIHGLVQQPDGLAMWIARRGLTRGVAPGRLDNMVAGGQPHGLSLLDNVVKEAGEEAGLSPEMARRAQPVGAVAYAFDLPALAPGEPPVGLRRDTLFVYDLVLGEAVLPEPQDDEVIAFELWPAVEALARAAATDDFKFNVPLTLIEFALRRGLVDGGDPQYMTLLRGLRTYI